jgi:hypothetical protein
VTTAALEGLL